MFRHKNSEKIHKSKNTFYVISIFLLGLVFFGAIKTVVAQNNDQGFVVTNTYLTSTNIGNYTTTKPFGTITLGSGGGLDTFVWSRSGIDTNFLSGKISFYEDFDTEKSLEHDVVPLADSIRDFPGKDFVPSTYPNIGNGNNGWSYSFGAINPENQDYYSYYYLTYDPIQNIWKQADLIENRGFENIGKYYSHPGTGQLGQGGAITRKWTSNISRKIRIKNTISLDNNNCGNGIEYYILIGNSNDYIFSGSLKDNIRHITIDLTGNINTGSSVSFILSNNGDGECDGTRNHIQIYDITDGNIVSGPPTINPNGKYGGALEFNGTQQQYALTGTIDSGANQVSISLRVKPNNNNTNQAIFSKNKNYGLMIKDGELRAIFSSYWMRHNTGIPIDNNRNHIVMTYGSGAKIYKNGGTKEEDKRKFDILGNFTANDKAIIIGFDTVNTGRGLKGLIDELRIYKNEILTQEQAQQLYESYLKVEKDENGEGQYREFISSKTGLDDATYLYTGKYDNKNITGKITIDTVGPEIFFSSPESGNIIEIGESNSPFLLRTGQDSNGLSGYRYRRYINNQRTGEKTISLYDGYEPQIPTTPTQHEPTTGLFELIAIDKIGNTSTKTINIIWTNKPPIVSAKSDTTITGYVEEELTFEIDAIDTGDNNISYQWFLNGNTLTGEESKSLTYTTGTAGIQNFKVIVTDNRGATVQKTFTGEWYQTPIFSGFNCDSNCDGNNKLITGYESENITITRTGYGYTPEIGNPYGDVIAINTTTGFDWTIKLDDETISINNTGNTITIPINKPSNHITHEPITGNITVIAKDINGGETTSTGLVVWTNTPPIVSAKSDTTITGYVEEELTFEVDVIDTGDNNISYQWFLNGNTLTGEESKLLTYTTGFYGTDILNFKIEAYDSHGATGELIFTGKWENPNLNNITQITSEIIDLKGKGFESQNIDNINKIIQNGQQGQCLIDGTTIYYTGNNSAIGEDYCIVKSGNNNMVIGFTGINTDKVLFNFTGTLQDTSWIISPLHNFTTNIVSNNLESLYHTISGTNNSTYIDTKIYSNNLLGLYNFDKIILTDSKLDFGAIQTYKGREYLRRPRGTQELTDLQFDPISMQRLIARPLQNYEGVFINSQQLNPGNLYGDIVLKWTSPTHANIEIDLELEDAIATCGNGIKYMLLKGTDNIDINNNTVILSGNDYGNNIVQTTIKSGHSIFLKINSNLDNECDTTNYHIKIYQLPETNVSQTESFSINNGVEYIEDGFKGGSFRFTNNGQHINLGNNIVQTGMSIYFWIYPENNSINNQLILIKTGSYGIILSNGYLNVTNQSTQQRYNTNIELKENEWNHIGWSYDGNNMKVYKNGIEERQHSINGKIPINTNPTLIGGGISNYGQFYGIIDELYIYSGASNSYNTYLFSISKESPIKRNFSNNPDLVQNKLYDGKYHYTITGGNDTDNTNFIVDFEGPIISGISGLTGFESKDLEVMGNLFDSGSNHITKYYREYTIGGDQYKSDEIQTLESDFIPFEINIPQKDEAITGTLKIIATDIFGHESTNIFDIERINTGPIISNNQAYEYKAKVGSNIKFAAMAIDTGSTLTYQRYNGPDCSNILIGETNQYFLTGTNEITNKIFSFKAFDQQGLESQCANLIGQWESEDSYTELILNCDGDRIGSNIECEIANLSQKLGVSRDNPSITGKTIISQGQKGSCSFTNNKTQVIYTRHGDIQGNDSCIIELDNGEHILLAFTNIHIGFWNKRSSNFPSNTITDSTQFSLQSYIYTPQIENIQIEWQQSEIDLYQNLIRKYSFDRIEITDLQNNFSRFSGENNWKYFWDNGNTTGKLNFNPKLQSRIINEPLQEYEYINLNKTTVYPGATKYGKIVYERTSNVSGNIDIESIINNQNPNHCTNTDGIIFTIKKGDEYSNSSKIYEQSIDNLNHSNISTTSIYSGQKLYFIIDSKEDNQCDKIGFNTKIYLNPIKDYSNKGIDLEASNISYNDSDSKFGGSYNFSANQSFLNIGIINQQNGLSFSFWLKTNSSNNQSIIYKEGSYGFAIKDNKLKVTTDGGRRYETNDETTTNITNGQRNHIIRTYDKTNMYIYINGQLSWTQKIIGYYPINNNPTYIGRSLNDGQLVGSIDELQVFDKFISQQETKLLYNTNIRKIDGEKREFIFKQNDLQDGFYMFTGNINSGSDLLLSGFFTGEVRFDNNPPILEILGSGNTTNIETEQGKELSIRLSGLDLGSSISGYKYNYKTGNNNRTSISSPIDRIENEKNIITLAIENSPTNGQIQVEIQDLNNNSKKYTSDIEWINIAPIAINLMQTGLEQSTVTFVASGYDPGGIKSYQRYSGANCLNILTGATSQSFSTGRREPIIETFSYKIWDELGQQGLSDCAIATGIRENIAPTSSDLYVTSDGNHKITFVIDAYDPGGTIFSGYLFSGNANCIGDSITGTVTTTGLEFTVSQIKSGTYTYSYYILDAQGLTGVNKNDSNRECQIATGHRPFINPIANDFIISGEVGNSLVSGNWKNLSNAHDPESNTQISATVLSGSKGYCNIVNDRVFFQTQANQTGDGYCEVEITDGNNKSSTIKARAKGIDTVAPITTINGDNETFNLTINETGKSRYKILTGVRGVNSCASDLYTEYIDTTTIDFNGSNYKTICFYSTDKYGNKESPKHKLFTRPQDAVPLNIIFDSNNFMKDLFVASITTNKTITGTLQGLSQIKNLNLNVGTHTITGTFNETSGNKTVRINLEHNEQSFSKDHTFQIDQISPTIPNIIETTENNTHYTVKWNASTDNNSGSGIKGYNYTIRNQHTTLQTGFLYSTYINIKKSDYQYNSWIGIKINAEDNVGNISNRSNQETINISQETEQKLQETNQTPNQFSFNKTTSAKLGQIYTSNEIIISGLSPNTEIPISLSNGSLFINDVKAENNSSIVKNGDIVYIQLRSSNDYSDTNIATLFANGVSATYTVVTENKPSSTTSFLEEFRKLLEQLQKDDSKNENKPVETNTEIDSSRRSAPHTAPNGKVYNLYKTIDGRYSSHNFVIKKYFSTLQEMKNHINKNNPK